jgi:hypothetical protein
MNGSEAVLTVISALDSCGIPDILVGSYSTNVYGIPRSTQDADFVIELGGKSIDELARRLAPSIRIDPQMSFETVTMTRRYIAEVVGTPFKIEFFLFDDDPHHIRNGSGGANSSARWIGRSGCRRPRTSS